jgi:hypothetical protein
MPQRFLRPGITTSQRFNSVPYQAQTFFVRLLTLVDDFGRYDGDFRLLRSHVFPLGAPDGKDIPIKEIERCCELLTTAGLVMFYRRDGYQYLQLYRWNERARAEKSRFPDFDDSCEQMFSDVSKPQEKDASLVPRSSPSPSFIVPADAGALLRVKFEEWMQFRRGLGKKPKDWVKMFEEQWAWLLAYGEPMAIQILSQSIRNGWQGLFEIKQAGANGATPWQSAKEQKQAEIDAANREYRERKRKQAT